MNFRGGVKEAAKMLAALMPAQRKKLLELIAQKDPNMAIELEKHLITIEDLKLLSIKQFAELLREVKIADLALSLRVGSDSLRLYVLNNVSRSIKEEIVEILDKGPQPVANVEKAMDEVIKVFKSKLEKGELVIAKEDEYV